MSRRRVTSREVAKAAGVSLTTVSYVLNDVTEMRISEETRQRVLEAAANWITTPAPPPAPWFANKLISWVSFCASAPTA